MADLAAYYAAQPAAARGPAVTDPAEGRRRPARSPTGTTAPRATRPALAGQQQVPRLAGQDLEYLLKLLRGFKARTASDLDGTMTMAAQPLTADEVESLAHYLASLPAP